MTAETPASLIDPTQSDAFWRHSGVWERYIDSLTIFGHTKFVEFYLGDWLNELPEKVSETVLDRVIQTKKSEIFSVKAQVAWDVLAVSIGNCRVEGDKAILPGAPHTTFYVNLNTGRVVTRLSPQAKRILEIG